MYLEQQESRALLDPPDSLVQRVSKEHVEEEAKRVIEEKWEDLEEKEIRVKRARLGQRVLLV